MWSRRVVVAAAACGLLFLLGFLALAVLADVPHAGAAPVPSAESRTPYGEMNLAWTEPGMIGVVGWAKDPDVNRPIDIVVAIDNGGGLFVRTAGVYNPYLPGTYAEKFRSYLVAIPTPPGPHTMCVAALNVGRGNPYRLLGCKVFDNVVGADPVGAVDSLALQATGDRARVSGWALDPETAAPLDVYFTVDGAAAGRTSASAPRADLAGVGLGTAHGFTADVAVTPGRHTVCAEASNYNRGASRSVGCRTLDVAASNPFGTIDVVTDRLGGGGVNIRGWAVDPDGAPVDVVIYDQPLDDPSDPYKVRVTASLDRPDVAAATGRDRRAGFDVLLPYRRTGLHEVCVAAVNVGWGRDAVIGCQRYTNPGEVPFAAIETVIPTAGGARLTGWATSRRYDGPFPFDLAVDGVVTQRTTSVLRDDVATRPGRPIPTGFDVTLTGLSAGRHTFCITNPVEPSPYFVEVNPPCASAIVGSTALGTTGAAGAGAIVGPTGPLASVDRDAGVSVTLRDNSVLWLFGDSTETNADGSLKYFVGGSGAWAPANQPNVTRDAVTPSGTPYRLATPGEGYPACSPSRPDKVMWPLSAIRVPDGARDRVVVFMANMCLRTGNDYEFVGISLAQWYYDPAAPPVGVPVQLIVINQQLGVGRAYGSAATYDPSTGFAYLYACDRPANPLDIAGFGPCRVARVDPVRIGEPAFYTYFNGSSWAAGEGSAQPLVMPVGAMSSTRYPAAAFTVTFDAAAGVWVMVYSPWPGFVDRAMVRIARSPQGPWTEPVEVALPGCADTVSGQPKACYAATAQPAFSSTGRLGLGYYDQAVPGDRLHGRYRVTSVPFSVVLS